MPQQQTRRCSRLALVCRRATTIIITLTTNASHAVFHRRRSLTAIGRRRRHPPCRATRHCAMRVVVAHRPSTQACPPTARHRPSTGTSLEPPRRTSATLALTACELTRRATSLSIVTACRPSRKTCVHRVGCVKTRTTSCSAPPSPTHRVLRPSRPPLRPAASLRRRPRFRLDVTPRTRRPHCSVRRTLTASRRASTLTPIRACSDLRPCWGRTFSAAAGRVSTTPSICCVMTQRPEVTATSRSERCVVATSFVTRIPPPSCSETPSRRRCTTHQLVRGSPILTTTSSSWAPAMPSLRPLPLPLCSTLLTQPTSTTTFVSQPSAKQTFVCFLYFVCHVISRSFCASSLLYDLRTDSFENTFP